MNVIKQIKPNDNKWKSCIIPSMAFRLYLGEMQKAVLLVHRLIYAN